MSPSEWIKKVLREAATKAKLEHVLGLGPKLPGGYRITDTSKK